MDMEGVRKHWDSFEEEQLKFAAELSLHSLAKFGLGKYVLERATGGERIESRRLNTVVGGIRFENPVMVGAGWDKKGWAVDGFYELGFAGTEVGTVLADPQDGGGRPRLLYQDGVAWNRFSFNSRGMEAVAVNLDGQQRWGVTGISVGKNKIVPDSEAPLAHAAVVKRLHEYADYFVINVTSPTPGIRELVKPKPLADIIDAVNEVLETKGRKPLFVKTTVDLSLAEIDDVIEVCLYKGVTGIIDSNTTVDERLKAQYGWQIRGGGLSGDNWEFRRRANERMKYITSTTRGSGMQRIGVGAISDVDSAIERIMCGAQVLQVVTGIRQSKGRIARDINFGILEWLDSEGVSEVYDLVGLAA